MENNVPSSYYAIIPAYIRYNKELKFAERLMYGEITALSNKEGYCFASNRYFAELYGVSISTISRWISHLAEIGSLHIEVIRNEKKEIIERRIYVVDNPYMQNNQYPYVQNSTYPICKKSKDNIININMLDSFYNYIINKEEKIPKEFENLEVQILDVLEKYEMIYPEEIMNCMQPQNIEKIKVISYSLALAIKENVGYLLYRMNREQIISLYDESKIRENEYKGTDKEIQSFTNYYYKSLKGQLLKGKGPSFFMSKNEKNKNKASEEDEEGEER